MSAVKGSNEMGSRRSADESIGILDQEKLHSSRTTTITSSPKEDVADNIRGSSEESTVRVPHFRSMPKNGGIQIYDLLERIRQLRELVWGLRSQVHEQRVILKAKQHVKAAADDKYMQLVRLKEISAKAASDFVSHGGKTLQDLFRECERVRAEYGPLEDDCNTLEDHLGSKEYELTRLEKAFVGICDLALSYDGHSTAPDIVPENSSLQSSSDVGGHFHSFHPSVADYLSKLGDVDIFRERHERHVEERRALEAEKETRHLVNLLLAPEDEAWLQQSGKLEHEILRDLHTAESEAEELRKKCLTAGLIDESGEPKDFQTQEHEAFSGDVDAQGQKSEYLKYPALLPQPGTRDNKFKASAPRPGEQSGSAGDHINQWLLHSLRSSPLNVYLLARTFEAEFGDIAAHQWQSDVRTHWYSDGSVRDESGYRIDSVTSETTTVYGRPNLSQDNLHEHRLEPVLGITRRQMATSDTSSVSKSEGLRVDGENESGIDPQVGMTKNDGNRV